MRVLQLIGGNLYGGVETFIACTARRRDLASDLEHHYAVCYDGRLSQELEQAGASVHRLGTMRTSRPWTVLRGRRRLDDLLDRVHFDVAITHASWPHAMFAPVLAKHRVPTVFYLHGPIAEIGWLDRWARRRRPTRMVAVSNDTLKSARRLFGELPASVLNYPIPWPKTEGGPAAREAIRAELGARPGDVVLLQASRADRWKGHDRLVDALGRLRDVGNWTLWLAGGAQRPHELAFLDEIRTEVRRLGLDERIRFLGERRDVPRLLAGADVYCQANTGAEGFSLVFMEAFTAGVPIVTTRLGGASELIDETCGFLVPPGDSDAFARALRSVIGDPALRTRLGENAQRRVWALCDPAERLADLSRILHAAATGSAS